MTIKITLKLTNPLYKKKTLKHTDRMIQQRRLEMRDPGLYPGSTEDRHLPNRGLQWHRAGAAAQLRHHRTTAPLTVCSLISYLLYTMFLDIKLLNEVASTLNTSLILIKAVNNYAIVTHELRKRVGKRDGGSQMKGCLSANCTIN